MAKVPLPRIVLVRLNTDERIVPVRAAECLGLRASTPRTDCRRGVGCTPPARTSTGGDHSASLSAAEEEAAESNEVMFFQLYKYTVQYSTVLLYCGLWYSTVLVLYSTVLIF